jgi:hypothetical protein
MTGRRRGRRLLWVVLGVFVAASLVPYRIIIAPVWRVEVVEADGKPRTSLKVTQSWTYYALMSESRHDEQLTNERGEVVFPMRSVRTCALHRVLGAVWELVQMGVHASFGPHAYIVLNVVRPGEPGAVLVDVKDAVLERAGEVFHREVLADATLHLHVRTPPTRHRFGYPPEEPAPGECPACHRPSAHRTDRGGPVPE